MNTRTTRTVTTTVIKSSGSTSSTTTTTETTSTGDGEAAEIKATDVTEAFDEFRKSLDSTFQGLTTSFDRFHERLRKL